MLGWVVSVPKEWVPVWRVPPSLKQPIHEYCIHTAARPSPPWGCPQDFSAVTVPLVSGYLVPSQVAPAAAQPAATLPVAPANGAAQPQPTVQAAGGGRKLFRA